MIIRHPEEIKNKLETSEGKTWLEELDDLNYKAQVACYECELANIKYDCRYHEYKLWLGLPVEEKEIKKYEQNKEMLFKISE